jgi:hypothetical protein
MIEGQKEYADRIKTVSPNTGNRVGFYAIGATSPGTWDSVEKLCRGRGFNVVIIDNITQSLESGGPINDDATVSAFFSGVRKLVRAGIAVVVIGHSSDKKGQNGYKPTTPLGSSAVSAAVRWKLYMWRTRRYNLGLKASGNLDYETEYSIQSESGARFTCSRPRHTPNQRLPIERRRHSTRTRRSLDGWSSIAKG